MMKWLLLPSSWYDRHVADEKAIDQRAAKVRHLEARLSDKRERDNFGEMFGEAGLGPVRRGRHST